MFFKIASSLQLRIGIQRYSHRQPRWQHNHFGRQHNYRSRLVHRLMRHKVRMDSAQDCFVHFHNLWTEVEIF